MLGNAESAYIFCFPVFFALKCLAGFVGDLCYRVLYKVTPRYLVLACAISSFFFVIVPRRSVGHGVNLSNPVLSCAILRYLLCQTEARVAKQFYTKQCGT